LDNKFFTTEKNFGTTALIHNATIRDIIFKRQIRETFVKINKKDLKLLHTLILLFIYKSFLKNTQFYIL